MAGVMSEKLADILKECQHIAELQSFTSKPNEVTIEEDPVFLEGYSSVIVRLRAGDGSTVIAKHAPPYARGFDSIPASQTRAEREMMGLQLLEKYIPGYVPKPFFYSSKQHTGLMEDLAGYTSLQTELRAGNVSKVAMETLGINMAKLHRATHKDNISAEEWAKQEDTFKKFLPLIEELAGSLAFYPYIDDPKEDVAKEMKRIADTRVFGVSKLNQLLDKFAIDYVQIQECLVHGDCHTQNILVKGDDGKMVDLEMVRIGSCQMDVGLMFGDLLCPYFYHLTSTEDAERHRQIAYQIRECASHMLNTYIEHMSWGTGEKTQHVTKFLKAMAAYSGWMVFLGLCCGMRTYLGAGQIPMLEASIRLMEQHHTVDSVDKIYSILALTADHVAV